MVFTIPPKDPSARENYCKADISRVWRRPDEHDLPELAGYDRYAKQVPHERTIPLWGGIGVNGFAAVLWHDRRKTNQDEWAEAVRDGRLIAALRHLNPGRSRGPWKVLCDNEAFLRGRQSMMAYRMRGVELVKLPAKSPDLNPVEKMWGWIRKRLRRMDLADFAAKRAVLGRTAYRERIRRLCRSEAAQTVAKNFFNGLANVKKRVLDASGEAVKG